MFKKFLHLNFEKHARQDFAYLNTDNFWNLACERRNQVQRYKAVMEEIKITVNFINYLCEEYSVPHVSASMVRLNELYAQKEAIAMAISRH